MAASGGVGDEAFVKMAAAGEVGDSPSRPVQTEINANQVTGAIIWWGKRICGNFSCPLHLRGIIEIYLFPSELIDKQSRLINQPSAQQVATVRKIYK